jgi:hypothetical protein
MGGIMKYLFVLLALIAAIPAHAERWLEAPNKTGGKIVLLAYECASQKNWRRAAATSPGSQTVWGCWSVIAGDVHIVYDDSSSYTYPTDFFKFVDTDKK